MKISDEWKTGGDSSTHGHFDHILAAQAVKEKYNIRFMPVVRKRDAPRTFDQYDCTLWTGMFYCRMYFWRIWMLSDWRDFSVQMIHTPGHTKGSCCYYLKVKVYYSAVIQCSMALLEDGFSGEPQQKL